jgi:Tol biopolymer transport system component
MSLASGARLGAYEILGPLGAGGMGEVYRARDTRLGREVAIKVLPADVAADPDRLARFEREAKAVSALNHPNIVTLHEVGTSEAGPYLVLERVEGQSLRSLIGAGPLPIRKLLDLGAQIAAGLAKAHAAGIVHRDLKPDNVMVTSDGFAKILDFGLARLVWPDEGLGDSVDTATFVKQTESGVILGTLGYLSPEQASGKPADYRADQFAFGALLYEMATGTRPFKRDTVLDSLAATVRDEPEPARTRRADLPVPVAWLIERCLAKAPDDRYASTKDLARDLAELRDRLSEISKVPVTGTAQGAPRAVRSRLVRWAAAIALVSALVAATFVLARRTATAPVPSFRPLTFERSTITGARFGPDDRTVYYSSTSRDGPSRIFVTQLDRTESKDLGLDPGFVFGVSAKDELLVLQTDSRSCCGTPGTLARVPGIGGTPRLLAEHVNFADWAADGERLAVVGNGRGTCEFLNGPPISAGGCGMLRVSPVNDDTAFLAEEGIVVQSAAGKRLAATQMPLIFGLAWSRDGREVWFTGSETGASHDRAIYTLSLDGQRRLIARAPGALTVYDVGRDGKSALITTGAGWWGVNAGTADRAEREERVLDLRGRTVIVDLTADGQQLLLDERREVGTGTWLRSTDGTKTTQLSGDSARGLSPDGLWALVQPRNNATRLTLISTGAGPPREVPTGPGLEASPKDEPARWSRDRHLLFLPLQQAGRPDSTRIYVRDMRESDGRWRAVTPEGIAGEFAVSPNGEWVAVYDDRDRDEKKRAVTLFAVDGRAPRRLEGEQGRPVHWSADERQLFLMAARAFPGRVYRRDLTTGRVEPWRTLAPADPTGVELILSVLIADDDKSYVYRYSRALNDLYLARDLR